METKSEKNKQFTQKENLLLEETKVIKNISLAKQLDKFYTKEETANKLFIITKNFLNLKEEQFFLEPSAGSGTFSKLFSNGIAYDIEPELNTIIKADFLTLNPSWDASTIAIGNPPFGKKGKLALEFLIKCTQTCEAVAFILPSTFRRWSIQSKIPNNIKLIYDENIPANSFTYEKKEFSLNCIYQIWCRNDIKRFDYYPNKRIITKPPIHHKDFQLWQHNATEQSKKYLNEDWEIATYRQGYKDYNQLFYKETDYETIKNIINQEHPKIQIFFIKPLNEKARNIIKNKMNLNQLAKENLSTPGFGKADFINYYTSFEKNPNKNDKLL